MECRFRSTPGDSVSIEFGARSAALSLEEYRVYGLAAAAIASLLLWSDLGISSAVARFTPELLRIGPGAAGAFLRGAARTRLLVLALIVGLLLIARDRWSAMETVLPFRDASLLFIVMAVTLQSLARIHQYFLTGLFQRKTIGVILLVASGAQSALVILAALLDTGVTGILGATALAALVELPLSRAASKSRGAFVAQDPSSPLPQDLVRDARRFGLTSFLEKLLSYLNSPFFVVFLIAALGLPRMSRFSPSLPSLPCALRARSPCRSRESLFRFFPP